MSLLLCRQENVKRPYYVEPLGIRIYSSQELSYVIYHYPMLVMEGFVGENLFEFMREELNQGFLVLKLEQLLKSGEDTDEVLIMILQECDYYRPGEINHYRQKLSSLRKKHPAEFKKLLGDELFSMGQYGRALGIYRELLDFPRDEYVDEQFVGRIWNNLGSCYARMFQTERAFEAYGHAYSRTQEPLVLKELYCLTRLDERLKLGERLKLLITEEMMKQWDQNMEEAKIQAGKSRAVSQLNDVFEKDSEERLEKEAELLHTWKQEYRSMI